MMGRDESVSWNSVSEMGVWVFFAAIIFLSFAETLGRYKGLDGDDFQTKSLQAEFAPPPPPSALSAQLSSAQLPIAGSSTVFFSLRHFGNFSHNCVGNRRNSVH